MPHNKTFYKIGTLARESGISPELLRAWEKRYALWNPARGSGGQRLYSEEDLSLVCYIAEATRKEGLRIGELAARGRKKLLQQVENMQGVRREAESAGLLIANGLESYIVPLIEAAETVNFPQLRDGLNHALLELSPDRVVYEVILPAMKKVGAAYLDGKITIAGEHMTSNICEHYLRNCIDQAGQAVPETASSPVICSCLPGEEHRLGLLVVMYTLAREGSKPVYFGSSLPLKSLEQAIVQIQPESIWLSVTSKGCYDTSRNDLAALAGRHSAPIILGGQGVRVDDTLLLESGCTLSSPLSSQPGAVQSLLRETKQ